MQDDGGTVDKAHPPSTYTETFWEVLPQYLLYGMTVDEFWDGLPILAKSYRELHRLRNEQKNQELWMQGMYVHEAFTAVMSAVLSKKGAKPIKYPEQPYRITAKTQKEKAEEKEKIVEDFRRQLDILGKRFSNKGGEKA